METKKLVTLAVVGFIGILFIVIVWRMYENVSSNPLIQGITSVLGTSAVVLDDFLKPCCKQEDCSKITSSVKCESKCGCAMDDASGVCLFTEPKRKVGQGGVWTLECAGVGFVAALVCLGIYRLGQGNSVGEQTKELGQLSGEKNADVNEKLREKIEVDYDKMDSKTKNENPKQTMEMVTLANVNDALSKKEGLTEEAKNEASQETQQKRKQIERAIGEEATNEIEKELKKKTGKDLDPFEEQVK